MKKSQNLVRYVLRFSPVVYFFCYKFPMWIFDFVAPQYPRGLKINIFLNNTSGDVTEIDIINHYIGMSKLSEAAAFERQFGFLFVIFFALMAILLSLYPQKKWVRILNLPGLSFPFAFLVVFYTWLYRFGHDLDPAAPIHLQPFTPSIIGAGVVGNFKSFAYPGPSFYLVSFVSLAILFSLWNSFNDSKK